MESQITLENTLDSKMKLCCFTHNFHNHGVQMNQHGKINVIDYSITEEQ